jgi:hypothetical protein
MELGPGWYAAAEADPGMRLVTMEGGTLVARRQDLEVAKTGAGGFGVLDSSIRRA